MKAKIKLRNYKQYLLISLGFLLIVSLITMGLITISNFAKTKNTYHIAQVFNDENLPFSNKGDQFGFSADMRGNTLVVGVPYFDNHGIQNVGMVYVFEKIKNQWQIVATLHGNKSGSHNFGKSVAVGINHIAVGAPYEDTKTGSDSGAVYIFKKKNLKVWEQHQRLAGNQSGLNLNKKDLFGSSLAFSKADHSLVVGAPKHDGNHGGDNQGAVYIFNPTISSKFRLRQEIVGSPKTVSHRDAPHLFLNNGDEFGSSLAIEGDRLVVGAPKSDGRNHRQRNQGAVYIFKRGLKWSLEQEISADVNTNLALEFQKGAEFGHSLDLKGSLLVVGAPNYKFKNFKRGAVFSFSLQNNEWDLYHKLRSRELGADGFGYSVKLRGQSLAVGIYDRYDLFNRKALYGTFIYKQKGRHWVSEQNILTLDPKFFNGERGAGIVKAFDANTLILGHPEAGRKMSKTGEIEIWEKYK